MTATGDPLLLRERLIHLETRLAGMVSRDPDSELGAAALRAIDALVSAAKEHLPDDPVVKEVGDLFSPEAVETGSPILASDARLLVGMVLDALPKPRRPRSGGVDPAAS